MDNQSMIISLFTPIYGVNLYLALAMNAMKNMSPVLPNLSNFQEKKKNLNIYVKFLPFLILGSHLTLSKIWFGTQNISLQVYNHQPKIRFRFLCIQSMPFQVCTCLPVFSTLFLSTLGNHLHFYHSLITTHASIL